MLFKSTVTFYYDINTRRTDKNLEKEFSNVLNFHKLPYSITTNRDVVCRHPFPNENLLSMTFHIERELKHDWSMAYLAMIIQGEAGLMRLLPETIGVDVSFD